MGFGLAAFFGAAVLPDLGAGALAVFFLAAGRAAVFFLAAGFFALAVFAVRLISVHRSS